MIFTINQFQTIQSLHLLKKFWKKNYVWFESSADEHAMESNIEPYALQVSNWVIILWKKPKTFVISVQ